MSCAVLRCVTLRRVKTSADAKCDGWSQGPAAAEREVDRGGDATVGKRGTRPSVKVSSLSGRLSVAMVREGESRVAEAMRCDAVRCGVGAIQARKADEAERL